MIEGRVPTQATSFEACAQPAAPRHLPGAPVLEPFCQLLGGPLTAAPQFPHLHDVEKDPPRNAGVSWAYG